MLLQTLLDVLPAHVTHGPTDSHVSSIQYDSRACIPGSLFVAVHGVAEDGHVYIPDAIAHGATAIVSEKPIGQEYAVTNIVVEDSRKALALISHVWSGYPSQYLNIIGVTGTNGKTTTTFILKALLEMRGEKVGIIGTTGNYLGNEILPTSYTTPEAPELCALLARMRNEGIRTVIMEVSSHGLALDRVFGIAFKGAVFTNLTQDHLDFHGTFESYAAAKKKLFDMVPSTAVAVANGDDEYGRFMLRDTKAHPALLYGRSPESNVYISDEEFSLTSTRFNLTFDSLVSGGTGSVLRIEMPLVGRFNVENAAACIGLCRALGFTNEELQQGMEQVVSAPGRLQRITMPNGAVAIVDYAHTPDALQKTLNTCRELQVGPSETGKLICVVGCGGDRDKSKRPLMGRIASELCDTVILTNDNPRTEDPQKIMQDILYGIPASYLTKVLMISDRGSAIEAALSQTAPGDVALIAGKGHETYQIIGTERVYFDDRETVRKVIARRWNDQSKY